VGPWTWRAIGYRQARSAAQVKRFVKGDPNFFPTISALRSPARRPPQLEQTALGVDVLPVESQQFTAAEAGVREQGHL
jgi:hypothetical protein